MRLRAEVERQDELSGHADQREILEWLKPIAGGLKRIWLVHGEGHQQTTLAAVIRAQYGIEVVIPARGQSFEL